MKKLYTFLTLVFCASMAQAQCFGTFQYPLDPVVSNNTFLTQEISNCQFAADFSVVTGLDLDSDYRFTGSREGDFLTITDEANNVLVSGITPVLVSAINVDTIRLHIYADADCAIDGGCHTTTIQCASCPPPPIPANDDCGSVTPSVITNGAAPVTFTGTTIGATASASETAVFGVGRALVWEAVELTGTCNDLTVDYCGTPVGNMSNAMISYADCLTFFEVGDYDYVTCEDGNITVRFTGLPAGIYYLPVISDSFNNTLGDYVMNVVSVDCPPTPDCAMAPIFPADGATGIEPLDFFTFTWTAPASGPAPASYDIYGGTDPDNLALFGNTTETEFDLTAGGYGQLLYWQVIARNGTASAVGCPVWSFTTEQYDYQGYCLYAPYGLYPFDTYTPETCDGVTENLISDFTYAGEYALLNVEAGVTYQLISSEPDLITISYDDITPEAYGPSPLTWTATTTGTIRFYANLNDENCGVEGVGRIKSVICDVQLSVDSFDANSIQIFPNPVKNVLTLKAQSAIQTVSVYNMLGQEVLTASPNALTSTIQMSQLTSGTYFVRVTIGERTETHKVVKH